MAGVALLTGAAYLLAFWVTLLHFLTVQHVVCKEHGQVMHLAQRRSILDLIHGTEEPSPPKRSSFSHEGPVHAAGYGHTHCLLDPLRREQEPGMVADGSISIVPEPAWPRPAVAVAIEPSIPLLSLAPKLSPPASI